MRPGRWTARLLLGLLVCWSTARAAPRSTELRGQVADENGVPVAGVEVRAQDASGAIRTAQSDETGHFSFQNLAPGTCRINLSKPGFYRLETSVAVPAEGIEVSYVVNHESEAHEKLEVHSTSDQIEPQNSSHDDELLAREIRNIPVPGSHVLQNSLLTLPTVLRDTNGAVHVAGGRTPDTVYLLDGFEIGDPITGALTARVDVDAVRGTDVESGHLHAGYAHATAGVMALDTVTGDDRWRFATTNFIPGLSLHNGAHLGNWYPRLSFSGPLKKGRLWFSDAISLQHTYNVVTGLPPGSDSTTQWVGDNLLRVQFNVTPRQVLQGSFLYDRESDSHFGLNALAPLSTSTEVSAHRYFGSLKDQIWFKKTLIEIGVAADTGSRESVPQGNAPYVVMPTGFSGNYFEQTLQRGRRWQAFGNVIGPSRHWHGTHQWAVGFNTAALAFVHTATRNQIDTLRQDGTLLRRTTFSGPANYRLSNTQAGAYAQDTWQAKKWLVVQAGVRVDGDPMIGRGHGRAADCGERAAQRRRAGEAVTGLGNVQPAARPLHAGPGLGPAAKGRGLRQHGRDAGGRAGGESVRSAGDRFAPAAIPNRERGVETETGVGDALDCAGGRAGRTQRFRLRVSADGERRGHVSLTERPARSLSCRRSLPAAFVRNARRGIRKLHAIEHANEHGA